MGLNRSSLSYQPRRLDDSMVRQRLRELAQSGGASAIGARAGY
jgi:hypothetical protein